MELEYTNDRCPSIEKFLKRYELEVDYLQSYVPCIDTDETHMKITKWTSIKLEQRICHIASRNPDIGVIVDASGMTTLKPYHIKCTPILEPISICRREYTGFNCHHWLANADTLKFVGLCNKVNSMKNTAYTDTLCSILLSKISHLKKTPHFGLIYGVYSGIVSEYEEEITEEFYSLREEKWFNRCLHVGRCSLKVVPDKNVFPLKRNISNVQLCDLDMFADEIPSNTLPMKMDVDESSKYFMVHPKVPVQIVFMEKFDVTFEDLVQNAIETIRETRYNGITQL